MRRPCLAFLAALMAAPLALPSPAGAQELRIALKAAVDGADPHQNYSPNRNVQMHVYDALVFQDDKLRIRPGLAESWRLLDPENWEFTLRDTRFSDGSPVTAEDVAFSIRRAQNIQGTRTYSSAVRSIAGMEATGPRTIVIRTRGPAPLLPSMLATIAIVSAPAVGATAEPDFNGGPASTGTGPYRWVRWRPGQDVVLERNPQSWREAEPWSRVSFRFIPNDSARVAALLANDADVVDAVPAALYGRVRDDERTRLQTSTSLFALLLFFDSYRAQALHATALDGTPLPANPFRDARVRRAVSHAINRAAIAERAMEGGAEPASQMAPPGFIGHDPGLGLTRYDPALSRRLLAEAGYPQGFALNLHCTNDRFAGDARTCQVVGGMLGAIGIRTAVETLPSSVYFRRAYGGANGEPEYTASMSIFASSTGISSEGMNSILRTPDPSRGRGPLNRGRYSNPALDALLDRIDGEFDDARREGLMQEAMRLITEDGAVAPIFWVNGAWGLRRHLTIRPSGDQYTFATGIRPAP